MDHFHRFKSGDRVTITIGSYRRCTGVVDSAVFQRKTDHPDEYAPGYHIVLDSAPVVTVIWHAPSRKGTRSFMISREAPAVR